MGPFDYSVTMANPIGAFTQSFGQGAQLREKTAQMQQQEVLRQAMTEFAAAQTPAEQVAVMTKYPAFAEPLRKQAEGYDGAIKGALYEAAIKPYALLKGGDSEGAIRQLKMTAEAFRNSNRPQFATAFDEIAKIAETSPQAAMTMAGAYLAANNAKEFEQFGKATEAEAKGAKAQTEAGLAADTRPFDLSKARAESVIKEAEAKFAPQKFLADLGLTKARIAGEQAATQSSLASAAASRATAARAAAEAGQIRAGIIPADKRPEAEAKFRKEYSDQTKGYQEVKSAYGRILASENTAAGDLSLIFNYMKMLDPGSVVRESEFATAQNTAGVPARIRNLYNKMLTGERLDDETQRIEFRNQAAKLYTQARTQEATVRKGIERIAKGYGLSPANIFYEAEETAPAPVANPPGTGVFRVVGRRQQ